VRRSSRRLDATRTDARTVEIAYVVELEEGRQASGPGRAFQQSLDEYFVASRAASATSTRTECIA
jgi:hypothetical protein